MLDPNNLPRHCIQHFVIAQCPINQGPRFRTDAKIIGAVLAKQDLQIDRVSISLLGPTEELLPTKVMIGIGDRNAFECVYPYATAITSASTKFWLNSIEPIAAAEAETPKSKPWPVTLAVF